MGSTGCRGISSAYGRFGDGTFDLLVGGRHDREATLEVHLVAVVGRRVVRRGDLDARRRTPNAVTANATTGVGTAANISVTGKSLGGKDFRCGEGELLGAVPGVAADDDV